MGQCVVREAMVRSREGSRVIDWWRRRAGEGTPRRHGNGARRSGMGERLGSAAGAGVWGESEVCVVAPEMSTSHSG